MGQDAEWVTLGGEIRQGKVENMTFRATPLFVLRSGEPGRTLKVRSGELTRWLNAAAERIRSGGPSPALEVTTSDGIRIVAGSGGTLEVLLSVTDADCRAAARTDIGNGCTPAVLAARWRDELAGALEGLATERPATPAVAAGAGS